MRRLQRLPLVLYFAISVVFYIVVIVVGLVAAAPGRSPGTSAFDEIFAGSASTFAVAMSVLANVAFTMGSLLGFRMVGRLLTGRYVRPRRESCGPSC